MAYNENDNEMKMNREYIENMIQGLKGENFGNKEQRQKFASSIFELCMSPDPMARKVIKYLGDMMTDYEYEESYKSKFSNLSEGDAENGDTDKAKPDKKKNGDSETEEDSEENKKEESLKVWTPIFEDSAYKKLAS